MSLFRSLVFIFYLLPLSIVYFLDPNIVLLFIIISIGFCFFIINKAKNKIKFNNFYFILPKNILSFIIIIIFIIQSQTILELINVILKGQFLDYGIDLAKKRYNGELKFGFFPWLASSLTFCASLLISVSDYRKIKKKYLLIYILILLTSLIGLARAAFLINIIILVSGVLFRKSRLIHEISFINKLKIYASAAIFAFLIYALPQYARVYNKENAVEIVLDKALSYSLNMYFALNEFLKDSASFYFSQEYKTFGFISSLFGITKKQGMYDLAYFKSGNTNIFTVIRGMIEDFGLALFPVIFFSFYYLAIKVFFVKDRYSFILTFWAVPLLLFPLYSFFYFNNVFFGYMLFTIIILFSKLIKTH